MAKPIIDIAGAANQQLRSVKKSKQTTSFTSSLKDVKNKLLAEEIVTAVLSELEGTDDFSLQLQNKITDIILGRITYSKVENDITVEDLNQLKEEIVNGINNNSDKISDSIKQAASKCASLVVDNTSPSDNSKDVISQLKELTSKVNELDSVQESDSQSQEAPKVEKEQDKNTKESDIGQPEVKIEENTDNKKNIDKLDDEIELTKEVISKQFNKAVGSFSDKMNKIITEPLKNISNAISGSIQSVKDIVNSVSKSISNSIASVKNTITAPFTFLSEKFSSMKTALKEKLEAPFKAVKKFFKTKILSLFSKKKKRPDYEKIIAVFEKTIDFLKNIDEKFVDFLKTNVKTLHKVFKKKIQQIVDDIAAAFIKKMDKLLAKIGNKITQFFVKANAQVTAALMTIMPWVLLIAAIIAAIGVTIGIVLLKFPEFVKPIIEVIPKIIDMVGQLIDFVVTKLWNFFKEQFWPFFEQEVWPFIRYKIWPFLTEQVFPIVEMIVDYVFGTVWPFLHETVWPFIADKLSKLIDFLLTKVWPALKDFVTWLRDDIITPIWESFVVPFFKWIVSNVIPFVEQYVAPVLATILEILDILLQAIRPWIKPLVNVILGIVMWLTELIKKILVVLEPVLIVVAEVISSIFVVVFEAIDAVVSPILKWLKKQVDKLRLLWNSFVDYLSTMELFGRRPFAFLAGCKFEVNQGPTSGGSADTGQSTKVDSGVSPFISSLVNGILNSTKVLKEAIDELVWNQVKNKIKNIFAFLRSQQESEAGIDEEALTNQLNSHDTIDALKTAIQKVENILKQLMQIQKSLNALVVDICHTEPIQVDAELIKEAVKTEEKQNESKQAEKNPIDVLLDDLFGSVEDIQDTNEEVIKNVEKTIEETKDENVLDFLRTDIMPLLSDEIQTPLVHVLDLLSKPPEKKQASAIIPVPIQNEQNYALTDQ